MLIIAMAIIAIITTTTAIIADGSADFGDMATGILHTEFAGVNTQIERV
jgi:archaellum component FlaG (FlaF/FlaG flagellin family)